MFSSWLVSALATALMASSTSTSDVQFATRTTRSWPATASLTILLGQILGELDRGNLGRIDPGCPMGTEHRRVEAAGAASTVKCPTFTSSAPGERSTAS
ncbi:MAG: hypothetical protein U0229_26500 [Anaeromyxobacter sp.]